VSNYIPKNIKAGLPYYEALEIFEREKAAGDEMLIRVDCYDHGRDMYGNGTAHYIAELYIGQGGRHDRLAKIVESGSRREQVGYSGAHEAAIYALEKLGYKIDESKIRSYDYQGEAFYPLMKGGK